MVMGVLTWADGHRMAIVPAKTEVFRNAKQFEGRDALVAPEGTHLPSYDEPHLRVGGGGEPSILKRLNERRGE